MAYTGENRRVNERFELSFPATLTFGQDGASAELTTRDISAGGAFLHSSQVFTEGTRVKIEIVLSNETLKKLTGYESCVKVQGTVVRSEPGGVAVSFDGEETIIPLRSTMDH